MAWNKPGDDDKDPWSGRDDQNEPPDLDEAIRALQKKLASVFGNNDSNGDNANGDGNNNLNTNPMKSFGILLAGAAVLWLASGFYIVDEGNHGVETRFGKYTITTQAGLKWHFPAPIEQVSIVNVKKSNVIEIGYRAGDRQNVETSVDKEALMLTQDENIIDVRLAVQYQVKDAKQFLFNMVNPEATLRQVTESVERGVVGSNNMDFVLTEGRSEIVSQIKQEIQSVMDSYQSGIQITSVNLQDAQPPEQVQSAFEDAIKAREDKQRLINEAEAYSNDVVPKARGAAARKIQEAEGYKEQVIAQATGEVSRFSQLLGEYKKAPDVTRQRIYMESMESVLSKSNTVMVDVKSNNLFLPLDKMLQKSVNAEGEMPDANAAALAAVEKKPLESAITRASTRSREERGRE